MHTSWDGIVLQVFTGKEVFDHGDTLVLADKGSHLTRIPAHRVDR